MTTHKRSLGFGAVLASAALTLTLALTGCGGSNTSAGSAEGSSAEGSSAAATEKGGQTAFTGAWVYSEVVPTADGGEGEEELVKLILGEDGSVAVEPILDAPMFIADEGTYELTSDTEITMELQNSGSVEAELTDESTITTIPEVFGATGDQITFTKSE